MITTLAGLTPKRRLTVTRENTRAEITIVVLTSRCAMARRQQDNCSVCVKLSLVGTYDFDIDSSANETVGEHNEQ